MHISITGLTASTVAHALEKNGSSNNTGASGSREKSERGHAAILRETLFLGRTAAETLINDKS